jgi:hypothetical protein
MTTTSTAGDTGHPCVIAWGETGYSIIGPFDTEDAASDFGFRWQDEHGDDLRWMRIRLRDLHAPPTIIRVAPPHEDDEFAILIYDHKYELVIGSAEHRDAYLEDWEATKECKTAEWFGFWPVPADFSVPPRVVLPADARE